MTFGNGSQEYTMAFMRGGIEQGDIISVQIKPENQFSVQIGPKEFEEYSAISENGVGRNDTAFDIKYAIGNRSWEKIPRTDDL